MVKSIACDRSFVRAIIMMVKQVLYFFSFTFIKWNDNKRRASLIWML